MNLDRKLIQIGLLSLAIFSCEKQLEKDNNPNKKTMLPVEDPKEDPNNPKRVQELDEFLKNDNSMRMLKKILYEGNLKMFLVGNVY